MRQEMGIKCLNPPKIGTEGFFEKINANYESFGATFQEEELMHLVTSAPEVYLEGNQFTTFANQNVSNKQEIKVELINNLLNRIVAYGTQDFTYQDTVYITNMLHKLGIHHTEEFMRQVKQLQEEQNNINKLTNIYSDKQEYLKKMIISNQKKHISQEERNTIIENILQVIEQTIGQPVDNLVMNVLEEQMKKLDITNLAEFMSIVTKQEENHEHMKEIYHFIEDRKAFFTSVLQKNESALSAENTTLQQIDSFVTYVTKEDTFSFSKSNIEYITNQLQEIGVEEVEQFIDHLEILQQENHSLKEYKKQFQNSNAFFESVLLTYMKKEEINRLYMEQEKKQKDNYFLHSEVMKRLDSSKIYQEVFFHNQNLKSKENTLLKEQVLVSEQVRLSDAMKVQEYRNEVTGQDMPLIYYRENIFEEGDQIKEIEKTTTEEKIASAILLGLSDQLYTSVFQQIKENKNIWFDFTNALYQTSENTLRRMQNMYTDNTLINQNRRELTNQIRQSRSQELHSLTDIIYNQQSDSTQNMYENHQNIYQMQQKNFEDNRIAQQTISENIQNKIEMIQKNQVMNQHSEENNTYNGDNNIMFSQNKADISIEESDKTDNMQITAMTLKEQLDIINQKNIERQKLMINNTKEQVKVSDIRVDHMKAMKDSKKAFLNPDELLLEYLTSPEKEMAEEAKKDESPYQNMDDQTKSIMELINLYQNNPEKILRAQNINTTASLEYLQKEINSVDQIVTETNEIQKSEEVFQNKTEEILKKVEQEQTRNITNTKENIRYNKKIDFIYKQENTEVTDQILEAIEETRNSSSFRQNIDNVTETSQQVTQTRIENINKNITTRTDENINEIVQRSMNQQLNSLTDKVYQQIEKKLSMERKRRGY